MVAHARKRSRAMKRVASYSLAMLMLASSFTGFADIASASGVATGSSGSISSDGATRGPNGGIAYLDSVGFRVGISTDKDLVNLENKSSTSVLQNRWYYRYPKQKNSALIFVPKGEWYSDFELGYYSPSSRKINKYDDKISKSKVIKIDKTMTSYYNPLKDQLGNYSFDSTKTSHTFSELEKGKWKKIAVKIDAYKAKKTWMYILGYSGGGNRYNITDRLNETVSPYADDFKKGSDQTSLPQYKAADIERGWLGVLMSLWRLAPKDYKPDYEQAIDAYVANSKQNKTGAPTSILIDTTTTMKWDSKSTRLILPTIDYFQFYTRVGSKYNMQSGSESWVSGSNTTFNAMEDIVQKDLNSAPKTDRISNTKNWNSAFAWGAVAIANGKYRFRTENKNADWEDFSRYGYAGSIMDVLKIGNVTGFNVANFTYNEKDIPKLVYKKYKFKLTPSTLVKVPSTRETLGKKNKLDIKMVLSQTERNAWNDVLNYNKSANKTVNVRIIPYRSTTKTSTSLAVGAPKYEKQGTFDWTGTNGTNLSLTNFRKFLNGSLSAVFNDDVSKAKIASGGKLKFTYTPKVIITYHDSTGAKTLSTSLKPLAATYTRDSTPPPTITPTINGTFTVSPKMTRLPAAQSKMDKSLDMTFVGNTTAEQQAEWDKLFATYPSENSTLKITATMSRDVQSTNTIAPSYGQGNAPSGKNWSTGVSISRANFKSFLQGTYTLTFPDNGTKGELYYPGETKTYTYKPKLTVSFTQAGAKKTTNKSFTDSAKILRETPSGNTGSSEDPPLTVCSEDPNCDDGSSVLPPPPDPPDCPAELCDDPPDPIDTEEPAPPTDTPDDVAPTPEPMKYVSTPSVYGEVKEGSHPDNEKFEAMAGVPSTKRLYYSIGGSEFIVDVELEYIQDATSVWRTYKSKFTGVPSEFKAGDNAGTGQIMEHTVSLHGGGTYTHTWSGSIPNNGVATTTNGSGSVSATAVAVPDMSAYNADLAAANAYAAQVRGTVLTFTSASDKVTRSHSGWGASVSPSPSPPQSVTTSNSCYHTESSTDSDGNTTSWQVADPCSTTASPSGPGSYTIVVSFTVPAHVIDGPECEYDLPDVEDNWKQRINFDYLKIVRANVYKLEQGNLTETSNVFGEDNENIRATIKEGDPTLFYNIAQQNAKGNDVKAQSSEMGRIRYSLEEQQDDTVVWNEGPRDNFSAGEGCNGSGYSPCGGGHNNSWSKKGTLYNNPTPSTKVDFHKQVTGTKSATSDKPDSYDMTTREWKKFDEHRNQKVTATVISDMIILQTSQGDQSVMYFDKDSKEVTSQEQFPDVKATREEMWENNPLSAYKWQADNVIIGSYNGNYKDVGEGASNNKKYWGYNKATKQYVTSSNRIKTRYDSNGAGVKQAFKRPAPSSKMYLYQDLPIKVSTNNGSYHFGTSEAFYGEKINWESPNAYEQYEGAMELDSNMYSTTDSENFDDAEGYVIGTSYTENQDGINDVVIHTPVSTQDAMIISLPKERDQRTDIPEGGAASLIDQMNQLENQKASQEPNEFEPYVRTKSTTTTVTNSKTTETVVSGIGAVDQSYGYTGGYQTYTVPQTGNYTLEVWGAKGGANTSGADMTGGLGGYAKGTFKLNKGDVLTLAVGGKAPDISGGIDGSSTQQNAGGWNGGGYGTGTAGAGGGGATDIRLNGTSTTNRIIVAGGGGGGRDLGSFHGGNTNNLTATPNGANGQNGYTGSYANDNGGGGGGYLGGGTQYGDDPRGAYGGSNYVSPSATDTVLKVGDNSGNGKLRISATDLGEKKTTVTEGNPVTTTEEDYSESGEENTYKGWTWEQLLGTANWKDYFDETVTTNTTTNTGTRQEVYENGKLVSSVDEDGNVTQVSPDSGTNSGSSNTPFSISNLQGLGYSGYGSGQSFTIPSSAKVGDNAIIYTADGNDPNNVTYKPVVPSDFNAVGSASNGRQVYVKKLDSSDLGRTITINGGSSWGYIFFTVPSNFDVNVINSSASSVAYDSQGKNASIVSILYNTTNANGYTTINNSYNALTVLSKDFSAATSFPIPQGSSWHNTNYPHMIFVNKGTTSSGTAGTPETFNYTGNVQTYTAPSSGTYQLETWGAQGGNDTWTGGTVHTGGLGGYAKGTVSLTKGQTVYVVVGGKGADTLATSTGGYNGGGGNAGHGSAGGGATHIATSSGLLSQLSADKTSILLVAGGGGGLDYGGKHDANGGYGGGDTGGPAYGNGKQATQTSGYAFGSGQPIGGLNTGAGGGGYYGGYSGTELDQTSYGGGGSGYIGGVTDGSMQSDKNTGNGKAVITPLSGGEPERTTTKDFTTEETVVSETTTRSIKEDKVSEDLDKFPDYMPDGSFNPLKAGFGIKPPNKPSPTQVPTTTSTGAKIQLATFLNIDYGFQVYFPNSGDFAQQPDLIGINNITTTRGKGYVNAMDTTEYTYDKRVKFPFAVIFNGESYTPDTWISLPLNQELFDFYNVLGNSEQAGAEIEFEAIPVNGIPEDDPTNENYETVTNKDRDNSFYALHGAYKKSYIDLVGRIGNLAVTDTDDFRFSNLFKQPVCGNDCQNSDWVVDGLVKKVDNAVQNEYYADKVDIRGEAVTPEYGLNTWGTQDWMTRAKALQLPINPKDNSNPALKEQFIKPGYAIYNEISTIGNYQNGAVRVLPYYYKLDVETGDIVPLDVYQLVGNDYLPVNLYKGADDGNLPSNLYEYSLVLDWLKEYSRRNYTLEESDITKKVSEQHGEKIYGYVPAGYFPDGTPDTQTVWGVTGMSNLTIPKGNYSSLGNAQRVVADNTARTFIGTTYTNGINRNPLMHKTGAEDTTAPDFFDGALPDIEYNYSAARWHLKVGLPSSATFVEAGKPVTDENIKALQKTDGVVLLATDIVSVGDTFSLRYDQLGTNDITVTRNGKTRTFNIRNSGIPPVIALYDLEHTSKIDISTKDSH